ncbi:hypothetical protein BY996DRAFT_6469847 [Phakopsora pachyrhizi]|nr:hypothetical protein BY996DRAFT_6469847 [Phakopsora pachyrhizi]
MVMDSRLMKRRIPGKFRSLHTNSSFGDKYSTSGEVKEVLGAFQLEFNSSMDSNSPLVWFKLLDEVYNNPRGGFNRFRIYRSIFTKSFNLQKAELTGKESRIELENESKRVKRLTRITSEGRGEEQIFAKRLKTCVILMIGGDHFCWDGFGKGHSKLKCFDELVKVKLIYLASKRMEQLMQEP